MAWDKGFNFRGTSGFVTDGTDETYVLAADTYPTTRNGVTFGEQNRDAAYFQDDRALGDRRLAGIYGAVDTGAEFRVDLPSTGNYDLRLAFGDALSGGEQRWRIYDNASILDSVGPVTQPFSEFVDASGTLRTAAAWPGSNVSVPYAFASTTLIVQLRPMDAADYTNLAHLFVSALAAAVETMGYLRRNVLRPRPFGPGLAR
jgi:hypothetical protein